jgi:hypothetical protein
VPIVAFGRQVTVAAGILSPARVPLLLPHPLNSSIAVIAIVDRSIPVVRSGVSFIAAIVARSVASPETVVLIALVPHTSVPLSSPETVVTIRVGIGDALLARALVRDASRARGTGVDDPPIANRLFVSWPIIAVRPFVTTGPIVFAFPVVPDPIAWRPFERPIVPIGNRRLNVRLLRHCLLSFGGRRALREPPFVLQCRELRRRFTGRWDGRFVIGVDVFVAIVVLHEGVEHFERRRRTRRFRNEREVRIRNPEHHPLIGHVRFAFRGRLPAGALPGLAEIRVDLAEDRTHLS